MRIRVSFRLLCIQQSQTNYACNIQQSQTNYACNEVSLPSRRGRLDTEEEVNKESEEEDNKESDGEEESSQCNDDETYEDSDYEYVGNSSDNEECGYFDYDSTDEDEDYQQEHIKYPSEERQRRPQSLRKRAMRMSVDNAAAPGLIDFLAQKGLKTFLTSRLGPWKPDLAAQTVVNRLAMFMTWSWKVRHGDNAPEELSGDDTILPHLKYLLHPVQHLKILEQYLDYLRAMHERQPGTLACIVDDVANCAEWYDYEVENIGGHQAVRTALSRLSKTYRNEQKERNLQVFLYLAISSISCKHILENSGHFLFR